MHYTGVTADTIDPEVKKRYAEVFEDRRVRIFEGREFSKALKEEILQDGEKFDLIVDVFGACSYSDSFEKTFENVVSLLKVGGVLMMTTSRLVDLTGAFSHAPADPTEIFMRWCSTANLKVQLSRAGSAVPQTLIFHIEKLTEDITFDPDVTAEMAASIRTRDPHVARYR